MTPQERINAQIDLLSIAGLEPGIDWHMKKMFGKPAIVVNPKLASKIVCALARIPRIRQAAREEHHEMLTPS